MEYDLGLNELTDSELIADLDFDCPIPCAAKDDCTEPAAFIIQHPCCGQSYCWCLNHTEEGKHTFDELLEENTALLCGYCSRKLESIIILPIGLPQ